MAPAPVAARPVDRRQRVHKPSEGQPLSDVGQQFTAGLLEHARAAMLFSTPTITGYKRYKPYSFAPDRVTWAIENRGAMVRVQGDPMEKGAHIENRVGEPAANPYLYVAANIAAGLDGIRRGLTPPPLVEADPYAADAPKLPGSLWEAVDAAAGGRLLQGNVRRGLREVHGAMKPTSASASWARSPTGRCGSTSSSSSDGRGALVDHHVHGVVDHPLDRDAFELLINEGGAAAPNGLSHFDAPVGLAVLMHCAPLLDLEPGCDADSYLEARAALGTDEVNQRLIRAAGLEALLVDTGHRPGAVLDVDAMADVAAVPAHTVARIEHVAEDLAGRVDGPTAWLADVGTALSRCGGASPWASRRSSPTAAVMPSTRRRPPGDELEAAAEAWFAAGRERLDSPVLLSHVLHAAVDAAAGESIPIQAHAGFGDTRPDAAPGRPVGASPRGSGSWERVGVDLVFLHCYPYHRSAGYSRPCFRTCCSTSAACSTTSARAPLRYSPRRWSSRPGSAALQLGRVRACRSSSTSARCCSGGRWTGSARRVDGGR